MPSLGCLGGDDGGEHGGLAVGGEHGAVGLAGDLAGFKREWTATPVESRTRWILNILIVFHGFRESDESHEQDGETLPDAKLRSDSVRRS